MDAKDRDHIKNNIPILKDLVDYDRLKRALIERKVMTDIMIRNVENLSDVCDSELFSEDKRKSLIHERLFIKITKRGPNAYQILGEILSDLGIDQAVRVLHEPRDEKSKYTSLNGNYKESLIHTQTLNAQIPTTPSSGRVYSNESGNSKIASEGCAPSKPKQEKYPLAIIPYSGEIKEIEHLKVKMSDRLHTNDFNKQYSMQSKDNRGLFVCFNIINFRENERRKGAHNDSDALLYIFHQFRFTLFLYNDLTQADFQTVLQALLDSDYAKNTECFVMALMTHGNMSGAAQFVEFSDGSVMKLHEIEKYFENTRCKNLIGKPKVMIFQFCRGDKSDIGVLLAESQTKQKIQTDSIMTHRRATISDCLICYASTKGYKAHRDPNKGSWYIQVFCELMAKHAHNTDLEDILKEVQEETSKRYPDSIQMGNYSNVGFNKKLYFNPGHWLDKENEPEKRNIKIL